MGFVFDVRIQDILVSSTFQIESGHKPQRDWIASQWQWGPRGNDIDRGHLADTLQDQAFA